MAKYTYKDIKAIQNCTPAELKDKAINELKKLPDRLLSQINRQLVLFGLCGRI